MLGSENEAAAVSKDEAAAVAEDNAEATVEGAAGAVAPVAAGAVAPVAAGAVAQVAAVAASLRLKRVLDALKWVTRNDDVLVLQGLASSLPDPVLHA